MSDEKILITFETAVSYLPKTKQIHTFVCEAGLLIGCDYKRSQILELLKNAEFIQAAGPTAQGMNHGIAIKENGMDLFIQTEGMEGDYR